MQKPMAKWLKCKLKSLKDYSKIIKMWTENLKTKTNSRISKT